MPADSRFSFRSLLPLLPVLALVLFVGILPFADALRSSFFHDTYGERSFAGWENFRYIFADAGFLYSLNITVLWAALNVSLSLFLGFLAALALAGRMKNAFYRLLLIPWGIPVYIAIPLWRAFLHGNGGESVLTRLFGLRINLMTDPASGFLGTLAVSLWLSIPLTAFVFASHMRKVSRDVVEAARIDGAGPGQIARHIHIPEIRQSLLAMGVLNFIKAFKEFTLVFLMTAGGPPLMSGITDRHIIGATTTLDVFLYEVFLQSGDWGVNAAYAVIMAGLVLYIMAIWIAVKRRNPIRPLLALTAPVLIPGGDPILWILAAVYLGSAVPKKTPDRAVWAALALHSVHAVLGIVSNPFPAGFHPGVMTVLLLVPVLLRRRKTGSRHRPVLSPSSSTGITPGIRPPGFRRNTRIGAVPAAAAPAAAASRADSASSTTGRGARTNGFTAGPLRRFAGPLRRSGGRQFLPGPPAVAAVFAITTSVILYMLIWMSLSRISACYVDSWIPSMPTTDNFRIIFVREGILRYFGNTLVVAVATAALLPAAVFPGAVALNRLGRRRTLAFLAVVQVIGIAGGMHTLIPLYGVFRGLGLVNTWVPLILIALYHAVPFSMFILTAYLEGLPSSFRDLARLEGMGSVSYAFRILVPLSLPPLLTAVMTAFIAAWNSFQAPLLFLNDERLYTISMKLFGYVGCLGSGSPVWNLFAAASVVNVLIIGTLFLRFRRPMAYSPVSDFSD